MDSVHPRCVSKVFQVAPWSTAAVLASKELRSLEEKLPNYKKILHALTLHENYLFSIANTSESAFSVLSSLAVKFTPGGSKRQITWQRTSEDLVPWTNTSAARLCELLTPYRLIDIACLVEGSFAPSERSYAHVKCSRTEYMAIPTFEKLQNWPKLVDDARRIFAKVSPGSQAHVFNAGHSQPRLIGHLCQNVESTHASKIANNFILAALHISHLLETDFINNALPDLPDKLEDYLSALQDGGPRLADSIVVSQSHIESLAAFCDTSLPSSTRSATKGSMAHFRSPLQIALWISPIALLAPMQLVKTSFNRSNLLRASMSLGQDKPPNLRAIELEIWKLLFRLVKEDCAPTPAICSLFQSPACLEMGVDDSWHWFSPSDHPFSAAPAHVSTLEKGRKRASVAADVISETLGLLTNATPLPPPPPTAAFSSPASQPPTSSRPTEDGVGGLGALSMYTDEDDMTTADSPPPHVDVDMGGLESVDHGSQTAEHAAGNVDASIDREGSSDDGCPGGDGIGSDTMAGSDDDGSDDDEHGSQDSRDGESEMETTDVPLGRVLRPRPNTQAPLVAPSKSQSVDNAPPPRTTRSNANLTPKTNTPKPPPPRTTRSAANPTPNTDAPKPPPPRKAPRKKGPVSQPTTATVNLTSAGGTFDSPIDVDLFASLREPVGSKEYVIKEEEDSLDLCAESPRVESPAVFEAYDAEGVKHSFLPSFHYADYDTRLRSFFDRMEQTYTNGTPLHIADPKRSTFHILTYYDYAAMTAQQLQQLLRVKNVVVTGIPAAKYQFDEDALEELHSLEGRISVQDYSYPPVKGRSSVPATVSACVSQLLDNARKGKAGKILNALEFSRWDASIARTPYASDLAAWHRGRAEHHAPLTVAYPTGEMYWGLAGTADSLTFMHIDCDGLNTGIQVMCGMKVWGIYRERTASSLSSIFPLIDKDFFLDKVTPKSFYDFEAIVLRPNDLLFMRPNTPHFVYGPENTICHGFHYYATSTLQDTFCGLVHTFVLSDFITNTAHQPTRILLRRLLILFYYCIFKGEEIRKIGDRGHIPDVYTMDGLLDLLSACNLVVLGNVLNFRTYCAPNQREHDALTDHQRDNMARLDQNDLTWDERMAACHVRGVAVSIIRAVEKNCNVRTLSGEVFENLPYRLLAQQMRSISAYKKAATRRNLGGAPHCTSTLLDIQLHNIAEWDVELRGRFKKRDPTLSDGSLSFGATNGFIITWSVEPSSAFENHDLDFRTIGTTSLDKLFFSQSQAPPPDQPTSRKRKRV